MSTHEAPGRNCDEVEAPSVRGNRVEAAAVLIVVFAVLMLARIMQPSPAGFGTHEQFFVIPCAFRWITGLPCPMCGMTTAFALMARGEVLPALSAHVLGPAFYLATWMLAGAAVAGVLRGRPALPNRLRGAGGSRALMLLIGAGWLINLSIHLFSG